MKHIGTIRLETDRLILRRFELSDAESVFNNWASDDEVTKYLTWQTHSNVDVSLSYMKYCLEQYGNQNHYQWALELKDNHELIGELSVVRMNDDLGIVELGWVIGRDYWGKGYMPEAAREIIDFLFNKVEANTVRTNHDANNPKSGRVMQKLNMKYEGTLRKSARNNQGIVDSVYYSILKEEWK